MTSLFMGALVRSGVPADEAVVRNTAIPVDHDAPAAMQTDMPEMGEVETDPNPNLGMDPRQMSSKWTEGTRDTPAWIPEAEAGTEQAAIINRQVASSGTAAAREQAGLTNKNLSYAIGIEPVGDLRDGGKMGNTYFVRHDRPVQDGMGNYMTPANGQDRKTVGQVAAAGKQNARDAAEAAAYTAFWNGGAQV
jgi:hypothetical protein